MKPTADLVTPMPAKLPSKPEDPFETLDEEGRPYLAPVIDDDSPSRGVAPGPYGNTCPHSGRSLVSNVSLVALLNWRT